MTRIKIPTSRTSGFTLIEVLATLMLLAIVMPAIMEGITLSTQAADSSRGRTEAAGIAQAQMGSLIATGQWQSGVLAGDITTDLTTYHWQAATAQWPQDTTTVGMQQLVLTVTWKTRNQTQSMQLATLVYNRTGGTAL
jgi:prepilin-type N-terminal cleavage/methylation domain-containing protein